MKWTIASVAAIALAIGPAAAQGQGNGGGNGKNNENRGGAVQASKNPGNSNGNRGGGNAMAANRGPEARANPGNGNGRSEDRAERRVERVNPGNGNGNANANANRGGGNDVIRTVERRNDRDSVRIVDRRDDRSAMRFGSRDVGLINGCPPGLAKKRNGCQPPGQARKNDSRWGRALTRPDWWGYRGLEGNYFYESGYLLRYSGDRISSYIPLLGGALAIGNPWPTAYGSYALPDYYTDYYDLGGRDNYRYADNVIYRVDPTTAAITSVAALLTGEQFTVGQPMPLGYDIYNVPYGYRDQYYDRPDALYRYNDGYVYQVDPETRLVQSVIELLLT